MQQSHDAHGGATGGRKAAVSALAIVGFVALILIGIATAIYAASFIPKALSRLGTANVYLGTEDGNTTPNGLVAVNPSEPAPTSVTPPPATTTAPAPTVVSTPTPAAPAPKPVYYPTYQQVVVPQTYYGRPDLVASIVSVGYLRRSGDTNSYVADETVPSGYQGAVRFSVANRGTDVSGTWNFSARLPSDTDSTYRSGNQRSLNPGDSIIFTLGFDGSDRGRSTIRVTVDSSDRVSESNENNNEDSATMYLNGGSSRYDRDYDSNGNYCRYGTYYQNGRYRCETSSNTSNNYSTRDYDSNGNYCRYGTYYQNGRYYCDSQNSNTSNVYDSFGNRCRSNVRVYQNGVYTCDQGTNYYDTRDYDSNGNYCRYGTYSSGSRYYCN